MKLVAIIPCAALVLLALACDAPSPPPPPPLDDGLEARSAAAFGAPVVICNGNGACDDFEGLACSDCGCDGDGRCEPVRRESAANCRDCNPVCDFNGACEGAEANSTCPSDCPAACDRGMDPCSQHGPLRRWCSWDVALVCDGDPYCCTTLWDGWCVAEVWSIAGSSTCGGGSCSSFFNYGDLGPPMSRGCGVVLDRICQYDPYCCDRHWDHICYEDWVENFEPGSAALMHAACGNGACDAVIPTKEGDFASSESPNTCAYDCAR